MAVKFSEVDVDRSKIVEDESEFINNHKGDKDDDINILQNLLSEMVTRRLLDIKQIRRELDALHRIRVIVMKTFRAEQTVKARKAMKAMRGLKAMEGKKAMKTMKGKKTMNALK